MIRFTKDGKTVMTESDNGDVVVSDAKLAESLKKAGAPITEAKEEEGE